VRARVVVVVAAMLAAGGCGGGDLPTTRELFGTWVETSDGTVRSYQFAATSDARPELAGEVLVYVYRRYPAGQAPVAVEVGLYEVAPGDGDATDLVTQVLWDETSSRHGMTFRVGLDDWDGEHVTLRDPRYGAVRYVRTDALP
jgi:hypothetical protein